jgi:acetyl esterase/lipase
MKLLFLSLAFISMFTRSQAQDSATLHLWPGMVPGSKEEKHPAKVTGDHSNQVLRLTDVTDPALTVFTPAAGHSNGSGILICPGGGYQILAINLEGYEIAHWLTTLGFTAFVLEYRVPNKRKGALQDVQRAMRVIRAGAEKWKLKPDRIGALGFSAGGSLTARISTNYDQNWYDPADKADRLSSRPDFAVLIYPAYLDLGKGGTLTPELKVNGQTPPMFIFQTADDPYGHSALVMANALREAKVPVELHIYPQGGHGYGLRDKPGGREWPALAAKWLEKQLAGSAGN